MFTSNASIGEEGEYFGFWILDFWNFGNRSSTYIPKSLLHDYYPRDLLHSFEGAVEGLMQDDDKTSLIGRGSEFQLLSSQSNSPPSESVPYCIPTN